MSDKSPIQWTDATWSPTIGCTRVSAGCDSCYAFALHDRRHVAWKRGRWPSAPVQYHQPFSKVQLLPDRLNLPLKWRKPRRIFVDSMADLFHEAVPDDYIAQVFDVMALAKQHTFQVLTKRPERMAQWVKRNYDGPQNPAGWDWRTHLPHNIWLGTSVEDQAAADERIPHLLATPAAVRFLSCEPLLDALDLSPFFCVADKWGELSSPRCDPDGSPAIKWVIIGGESGPRARFLFLEWVRALIGQCEEAGAAAFVKQLGSKWATVCAEAKDRHGGNPEEWPADLRVRQYPTVRQGEWQ